jgi:rare lipoprotein A (peptidoglycan hydrolase)
VCGKCIEVKGPKGSVVLSVADKCPGNECVKGSIDIAENAFTRIAEKEKGRVKVEWKEVPCGAQSGPSGNNQTMGNSNNNGPSSSPGNSRNGGVIANHAPKVSNGGLVVLIVASMLTTCQFF